MSLGKSNGEENLVFGEMRVQKNQETWLNLLSLSLIELFFFDTTCNSWHGLPDPLLCPEGQCRKSIAVYYLQNPRKDVSKRGKALFAPSKDQEGNKEILELIKKRSDINQASAVYGDKD